MKTASIHRGLGFSLTTERILHMLSACLVSVALGPLLDLRNAPCVLQGNMQTQGLHIANCVLLVSTVWKGQMNVRSVLKARIH